MTLRPPISGIEHKKLLMSFIKQDLVRPLRKKDIYVFKICIMSE